MIEQNRMDRLMYQNQMDQRQMPQNQMNQRQMSQNQMNQRQMSQNQMSHRQMSQNQMSQRQMSQNQFDQSRMDQNRMGHRMANPMVRIGNQNDPRMYSRMEQDKMDMVNRRMRNDNRRQTAGNRMMRNNNVIERGQMQSGRMMKREAGPSFSYTVS